MRPSIFFPLFFLLLVIGGFGLLLLWDPEYQRASSEDGLITISGLARESQPFLIESSELGDPFTSAIYTIEPSTILLETLAQVEVDEVLENEGVYRFDTSIFMWHLQARDEVFETDRLGSFALAPIYEIEAPEFASLRSHLHALAPEDVVGYDVAVGVEMGAGVFHLDGMDEQGGCDGGYAIGGRTEQSRLEQSATVPVNGVDQLVTFVYIADWQIQDDGGCGRADLAPVDSMVE